MKTTRLQILLLLFLFGAMASWAQDFYKPGSSRVTALETGRQYMIFNTAMTETEDRTGFLYNSGTSLNHNKTKCADDNFYNSQFLFTLEEGEAAGTYKIKSVSNDMYVNISGATNNATGTDIYIAEWSAAKADGTTIAADNFADVGSYGDDGTTTANADISATNAVYIITTATDSGNDCWNGNTNSFAAWQNGHPFAFYEAVEYENAGLAAAVEQYNTVSQSLNIYNLQQKYGLVQDASRWVCNYPSDPVDGAGYPGLVDGDASTHFHTGYSGHNPAPDGTKYYLQADLGYQVTAFNIYIQGRSGGGTRPAGFVIEGSNDPGDDSSWATIASSWSPSWSDNGCLSAAFATGGEGYRYIRFTHTSESYFALGEFYILPSNYVVDNYRSFLSVAKPISGIADAIVESLSAIDYQNLMSFAGALKPVNGYKYYIYANTKYNGSYVPRYIYNTGTDDAISVTTSLVENSDSYIWTCETDESGNYYFKNSAGRYLAYNSGDSKKFELVDDAYAFTLKDDANTKSAGAWSLYSNDAGRYVVTATNGSSVNQYRDKEGADESWCSDYMFIAAEGEQKADFVSGETYYVSAYALQSDDSYKKWYLYATDDGSLATADSNAETLNYRWTITVNSNGSYYMRNGNGKFLSYASKSLQLADAAYAFNLTDVVVAAVDETVLLYSLYNPTSSGGKYMVTSSTTASTWNQNGAAINSTSWTSDYVFEKYTAPEYTVTVTPYINNVGDISSLSGFETGSITYLNNGYTGTFSFKYLPGADLPAVPAITNPIYTFDGYYKDDERVGETLAGESIAADVTYQARYSLAIFTTDLAAPVAVRVYNYRNKDYAMKMNADSDGDYTDNAVNSGSAAYTENEIWYLKGTADNFQVYSRTAGTSLALTLSGTGGGSAATLTASGTPLCLVAQDGGTFAICPQGTNEQSFNMHGGAGHDIKLYSAADGGSTWLFKLVDTSKSLSLNYNASLEGGYENNYKIGELTLNIDGISSTTMFTKENIPASSVMYLPVDATYGLSVGFMCHGWTMDVNGSESLENQVLADGGSTVNVNIAVDTDNKYQYLFYSPDEKGIPFRIPAITTASDGTVLAFSDYRPCGGDIGFGEVDIMLRRSSDNGETWGAPIKIADGQGGSENVFNVGFGDAAVVADRESGNVLVMSVAGKQIFYSGAADSHNFMARITSSDNGVSWNEPTDVTSQFFGTGALFPEAYTMFFGSGRLLQSKVIKVNNYYRIYGALLIKHPSSTYTGNCNYVVYSDDFGETWNILGGNVADGMCCNGGDEPKVEELADGTIILSSRKAPGRYFNVYKFTDLETATGSWGTAVDSNFDGGLQAGDNACNGEIIRLNNYLFQSLPYGPGRSNVKIYRKKLEEGAEITPTYIASGWEEVKHVSTEYSAYSAMTILPDNKTMGFLFEESPGDYSIVYLPIPLEEILPIDGYAAQIAETKLPKLSTGLDDADESNDEYHYYRIVNTKKDDTYAAYEGDTRSMSLSNGDASKYASQLFYFTGEKITDVNGLPALKVKIHNVMAGDNLLAYDESNNMTWTADGSDWYITASTNADNPGFAIVRNTVAADETESVAAARSAVQIYSAEQSADADSENLGWNNDQERNTTVAMYTGTNGGSHWEFEEETVSTEYQQNAVAEEKASFNEYAQEYPESFLATSIDGYNAQYDAAATGDDMASLVSCLSTLEGIRAAWSANTVLETTSSSADTKVWYALKNIRNGNYATFTSSSNFMKESAKPVPASLFYFTEGSVEGTYKIHNHAAGELVCAGINSWTADGVDYYIYDSAEPHPSHANPGMIISTKASGTDEQTAWSDHGGNTSEWIKNYKPSDAGSTWVLAKVEDFEYVFELDSRIDEAIASLEDAAADAANKFYVNADTDVDIAKVKAELTALKDEYPESTYDQCVAADEELETLRTSTNDCFKESVILYFNNVGNSDYWLGANIPNAVNATYKEYVHTNVWRIDHVNAGEFTLWNEAGNRYVGVCPDNTGGSLAVPAEKADAGKFTFAPADGGGFLIKSADVDDAYLKLNVDGIATVVTASEITDFAKWNVTTVEKIEISEALYAEAASIVWTDLPAMNNTHGLVRIGSMLSSKDNSDGIAQLVDNDASTVFGSKDGETDYIQVDLGDGAGVSDLFFFMRAGGLEKRPIKVTVSVSDDGVTFTQVGEQLTTDLGYQAMYLSELVSADASHRYWRFTVDETNSGSTDFVLSEFMVFKNETYVSDFFTEANNFYETKFETLDAVTAAVKLLKVEAKYYIDRVDDGIDVHNEYAKQELGHYLTEKFDKFKEAYDACPGDAATSADIESRYDEMYDAMAEYLDSKNRPVFYVHNAYEDGYSNGIAVLYNGSAFDTDELSKWDYRQMFYEKNLDRVEFANDDEGNVLATTFERHLISYNGDKPLYNSSFTEFTPMSDWRVANGYTAYEAEEKAAYNIDVNNSGDGEDYLGVQGNGLNLGVYGVSCELSDDAGYSNRHTAWYVTYVCDKKNLDRVSAVTDGSRNALEHMNDLYVAYKKLKNRIDNVGEGFNEYKWTAEGEYAWSTLESDVASYTAFLSISMADLADGLEAGTYAIDDITSKTADVNEYINDFELNVPQKGRYYRFAGMSKQHLPQDYYITGCAEMHATAKVGQQKTILMKSLYENDEVYEQNESTTIFYYGEHTTEQGNSSTYLLSYDTGRFIGVKEYWKGESMTAYANNWNFEKVGEKRGNVVPVTFAASVVSYTSPAYSIRMGSESQYKYLYAGGDYIDRGGNPTGDAEYYRYDWAVELVTELPLTITSAGFATYYVPVELQIPEGVRAFVLYEQALAEEGVDLNLATNEMFEEGDPVFRLRPIEGGVIPAETPVILQAEAGTYRFKINYEPTLATDEAKAATYCYLGTITNLLEGTHEQNYIAERDGYTHYILANKSKGVGMYKVKTYESLASDNPFGSGTITTEFATKSFLNREHRAWLPFPAVASQSGGLFSIEKGGESTGINEVDTENEVKAIYDLQGRKLDEVTQPGIYIVNGKRVLVK